MLLGVEVYAQILKGECLKGPPGSPCAQNTNLGWILFGNIQAQTSQEQILVMHHQFEVDDMLKTLWEVDTDITRLNTNDEETCEKIYKETHTRNEAGRYIVKLPFRTENPKSLEGNTREGALKRLLQLERRFKNDNNLKIKYTKAINEYCEMGHMEEVPIAERNNPGVYLPHHPVFKHDSETTQIRPVFDASYKGTNNIALNDELLVGPQIQEDIRSLVMRWRLKRVAFVADIQKMYRQILIKEEDMKFQRILWRTSTLDPVKEYRLQRVTFGTACAPYLAVKTLHQVAEDEGQSSNRIVIDTIKQDFYMDDLMSGEDTVEEALALAKEVSTILKKGGFILQKWASNQTEFLKAFDSSELSSHVDIDIKLQAFIKTLGLSWNVGDDMLEYRLNLKPFMHPVTKRKILSDVQTLFDPLGWLAPALVPSKILIQKLWLRGLQWDEQLEPEIEKEWLQIRESLIDITDIKINRWLGTTQRTLKEVTIHGYCDASMKAYAAVAYLRVQAVSGEYNTFIIAAKTKVAPIKSVSLPRLELCGAVLLSKLLKQISESMRIPLNKIFCWTDSTIVLSWLQGDPNRWQTFVRNRVITILDNVGTKWYHITSQNNPADIGSRGMLAPELKNCSLWWHGPHHLKQKNLLERLVTEDIEVDKLNTMNTYLNEKDDTMPSCTKLENFHDLSELLRVVTYAKRFLNHKRTNKDILHSLTAVELEEALQICIKITQEETFMEDILDMKKKDKVKTRSPLRTLNPYLDSNGIVRVGGRIKNSELDYNRKHPIILDNKSPLTNLLIGEAHKRTLHGGVDLMLNYLRSKYWIFKIKNSVKAYIHRCLVCARINAKVRSQLMGELPKARVTPARPFLHSGVDFAGPYDILMSRGRGAKTKKAYISIFVCMSTKAVHLELVGNLTSEAFIGAYRRFTARRGQCSDLWSDQGRNFVSANKDLAVAFNQAKFEFGEEISELLASEGTQWHFIPAYSPSMGGLWEAGVKSMKHHIKRIMNTNLTFEEMTTLLCEVEACLNSRPLCPMENPNSLNVLTPGHFLIGEAPVTIPSPSLKDISISSLSRWQYTQKLLSNFWERWQQEYLTKLQQRPKWQSIKEEFDIGQVVLIKTEGMPPGKWHLGRIVSKHPGPDGLTRVYSVKSGNNIVKRSISKLCFIPVDTFDK